MFVYLQCERRSGETSYESCTYYKTIKMRTNGKSIKTSEKDFNARAKSYSNPISALNEVITNSFFAKNTSILNINFFKYNDKECLLVKNDGEFFAPHKIDNALSFYGCESANTAGNENGTGLKSFASYFTNGNSESFFMVVSKSGYGEYACGLISHDGLVYLNEADFEEKDKQFIEYVKNEYLSDITEGTVTAVYDAAHTEEIDCYELERTINDMLTIGLNKVKCSINDNGRYREISYVDKTYKNINDPNIKRLELSTTFTYRGKIFKADVFAVDTHYIETKKEYYNAYDEINEGVTHSYGFTASYDNGYTPLYRSSVGPLGLSGRQQYYRTYSGMIAHPIENDEKYASTRDWQKFYSEFGRVNAQKIPDYSTPFNFFRDGKLIQRYESFYNAVIEPVKRKFNEWMPEEDKKSLEKEIFDDDINRLVREKMHFMNCDTVFIFNLKNFKDEDEFIKYEIDDNGNHFISFNIKHKDISKHINKGEEAIKMLSGYFRTFKAITYGQKSCGDTERAIKTLCKQLNKLED